MHGVEKEQSVLSSQRKSPHQDRKRSSNAGGSATHAGTGFQDHVAVWIAVRILDEQNASAPWELASTITLEQLHCETSEPVDDLLVITSIRGCVFIQAKHSLNLEKKAGSDLASCLDQFTRQYQFGAPTADQGTRRPLDVAKDRMVIATSTNSSEAIRVNLPTLLKKLSHLLPSQTSSDAVLSEKEQQIFGVLQDHIRRSWQAYTEVLPCEHDILQLLSFVRVQTLNVDEGQNDELWAKDILRRSILQDPTQSDSAWSTLYRACANRAINHSGANRRALQHILLDACIEIKAPRSYRSDIERLQQFTESTLDVLSGVSEIVIGAETVKIHRSSTGIIQTVAEQGSLVVLGLPGVGKSVALYDLVKSLRSEGRDVVFFTIDTIADTSRLTHDIVDVLKNWPGSQPAFLVIDALDTARFNHSERTVWNIITRMMTAEAGKRWRVIASIRNFDLTHNRELHRLFAGTPPIETLQDANFAHLRHIAIPPFSMEELQQVTAQSSTLAPLLNEAKQELRDLLRIPFNLRLVGELLHLEVQVHDLVPIRAQIQLLDMYWSHRVLYHDGQQYVRETVLHQACDAMVEAQTFRVDLALLANPTASLALCDLQSSHILTAWRSASHAIADDSILSFSHRILFDYTVARLLLSGDPKKNIIDRLVTKPVLVISIRPSLVYRFQREWLRDPTRSSFWELTFLLLRSKVIPSIGKLVGPTVAVEFTTHLTDFDPLLTVLRSEDAARRYEAEKALQHIIGAVVADQQRPLAGSGVGPWCELLERISQVLRPSNAFIVRVLLSHIVEQPESFTESQLHCTGITARRLLKFTWEQPVRDATSVHFAVQGVCRTYESDPSSSQTLLCRCLEPTSLSMYGYKELPVIAREIKRLIALAPEFVADIYLAAFSHEENSEEKTPMGTSQILTLMSTRRQDYNSALYQFAEAYPELLRKNSLIALQTLLRVIDYRCSTDRDPVKEASFDFNGVQACITLDTIGFWNTLDDPSLHDPLDQMIIAFVTYLGHIAEDSCFANERRELIDAMVAQNRHGLLWRHLIMEGTKAPKVLGQEIRTLTWAIPILTASATSQVIGTFLSVIFDTLVAGEREQIERAILSIPTIINSQAGEHIRDRLLGCLEPSALVTEESKERVTQLKNSGGAPSNEPFIASFAEWVPERSESGFYPDLKKPIQTFITQHSHTSPTTEEIAAILPTLQSLEDVLSSPDTPVADAYQLLCAWGDMAEACERITGWNQFSCTSNVGQLVLSVLLKTANHPEPIHSPEKESNFDKSISWGKPAPRIDAAAGLTRIARHQTCISTEILGVIKRLSSDPVSAVRYQIASNIGSLFQTAPDMMWEILERMCSDEPSRGVLQGTLYTLKSLVKLYPDRIFELTKRIYDRVLSGVGAENVRNICISIFAWLYFYQDHRLSYDMLFTITDTPSEYAIENRQILGITRNFLTFGPVTSSSTHTPQDAVRQRAWFVVERIAKLVTLALQPLLQQSEEITAQKDEEQQRLRNLLQLIDSVGADLHFASGASNDANGQDRSLREKIRFLTEAEPLLDILDTIPVPNLTHHLLQMLESLIPANPSYMFLRIGYILLGGKDGGYQYEVFAVDLIVRVVERYLAEFRDVLREKEECLQMLINILDIFVDVGWPSARRLTYRIDEIFR